MQSETRIDTRVKINTSIADNVTIYINSGVGSNLQVGAQCRRKAPAEIFLMSPPTFLLCPHMRGHNDCLLPTERQWKCPYSVGSAVCTSTGEVGRGAIKVMGPG